MDVEGWLKHYCDFKRVGICKQFLQYDVKLHINQTFLEGTGRNKTIKIATEKKKFSALKFFRHWYDVHHWQFVSAERFDRLNKHIWIGEIHLHIVSFVNKCWYYSVAIMDAVTTIFCAIIMWILMHRSANCTGVRVFSAFIKDRWNWPLSTALEMPAGASLEIMTVLAKLTMCAFTCREIMMKSVNRKLFKPNGVHLDMPRYSADCIMLCK